MLLLSAGTGIGALALYLTYDSFLLLPAAFVFGIFFCRLAEKKLHVRRTEIIRSRFPDFLASIQVLLRAGYSPENGIRTAADELRKRYGKKDPLSEELMNVLAQLKLRINAGSLFCRLGEKTDIEEIRIFGEVLSVSARNGGDLVRILKNTRRMLYERIETEKEIRTILSEARYELLLMSMMPPAVILYLRFSFPEMAGRLYGGWPGAAVMTVCLLLYAAALWLGSRLTAKKI